LPKRFGTDQLIEANKMILEFIHHVLNAFIVSICEGTLLN